MNSLMTILIFSSALVAQDEPSTGTTPSVSDQTSNAAPTGEVAQSTPPALELSCTGGGNALKSDYSTASIYGSNGGSASGWGTSTRSQGFEGQVDVNLFNGDDRIRLPRIMLPPAHGGANGWFKVKELTVTDREITGRAALNLVNTPKFRIDRTTGAFEISGLNGAFSGSCRKIDRDKPLF